MAQLSAKEAAIELGIDARTFRKFMRAVTPEEDQPGQGNRWHVETKDIKKLKKKYADWSRPKAKAAAKTVVLEPEDIDELDDGDELIEDELFDEVDGPSDEELAELELEV
jgi:hypothetical protein